MERFKTRDARVGCNGTEGLYIILCTNDKDRISVQQGIISCLKPGLFFRVKEVDNKRKVDNSNSWKVQPLIQFHELSCMLLLLQQGIKVESLMSDHTSYSFIARWLFVAFVSLSVVDYLYPKIHCAR